MFPASTVCGLGPLEDFSKREKPTVGRDKERGLSLLAPGKGTVQRENSLVLSPELGSSLALGTSRWLLGFPGWTPSCLRQRPSEEGAKWWVDVAAATLS